LRPFFKSRRSCRFNATEKRRGSTCFALSSSRLGNYNAKALSTAHTYRRFSRKVYFAPFSSTPFSDDTTSTEKSQDGKTELFDFLAVFLCFCRIRLQIGDK